MKIYEITKWVIDEFTKAEATTLTQLGWKWRDAYDPMRATHKPLP